MMRSHREKVGLAGLFSKCFFALRCYSVVSGGFLWFRLFLHGFRMLLMISNGFGWYSGLFYIYFDMVLDGFGWFLMVLGGSVSLGWFWLVLDGFLWFSEGFGWFLMVF